MVILYVCVVCGKCFSVIKGVKFLLVFLYKEMMIKEIVGDGGLVKIVLLFEEIGILVIYLGEFFVRNVFIKF